MLNNNKTKKPCFVIRVSLKIFSLKKKQQGK